MNTLGHNETSDSLNASRRGIFDIVQDILPIDREEAEHKESVLEWIMSGAPLYRITKPANPPQHLVSYFVLVDIDKNSVFLVDHRNAQLWLPTGGHVEMEEDPRRAVEREAKEELGIEAKFTSTIGANPLFLTSTVTTGLTAGHTDISLWYVLEGKEGMNLHLDTNEFANGEWFTFEEVYAMEGTRLDPHMHRFIRKLTARLGTWSGTERAEYRDSSLGQGVFKKAAVEDMAAEQERLF